jgi:hypothetical protein
MKPSNLPSLMIILSLLMSAAAGGLLASDRGSITGKVYCDRDKNGVCDCEEGGLKDITVEIFAEHCGGTPLQTVSTDEKGNFIFDRFDPGTYFVMVDIDYVCGGRVPTTASCRQVELVDGETVDLPAFGYTEFGQ